MIKIVEKVSIFETFEIIEALKVQLLKIWYKNCFILNLVSIIADCWNIYNYFNLYIHITLLV